MRFSSLGSGSKGNSAIVESGKTRLMVDCGFAISKIEKKLANLQVSPDSIDAVVVTHEHSDHIAGLARFCRKYMVPVWLNKGTYVGLPDKDLPDINIFSSHQDFSINDINISPFPVPHDSREPVQFVFSDGDKRLGMLSDLGKITPHVLAKLTDLNGLVLECNHDRKLLEVGPYPRFLKERVGGGLGHLSNEQSAMLLSEIDTSKLQHIALAHISEKNNKPDIAVNEISKVLNCSSDWIQVACQDKGISWREIV